MYMVVYKDQSVPSSNGQGVFHMLLSILILSDKPLASMAELGFPVDTAEGKLGFSLVTSSHKASLSFGRPGTAWPALWGTPSPG